ncbi:MAG: hypothetical protein ABIL46_09420 [candidate division WOR-3 bacterium]
MVKKFTVLCLFIFMLNNAEASKAKLFGIIGFTFSITAIASDIAVEHFYNKYENADLPEDCIHYRNMTQLYEKVRDVSFGLSVLNFSLSTVFFLKEKRELKLGINYQKGKICLGLLKYCY